MRRPGRSNGLLVGVASAILQPVDVWPSGLLPGQAPVRSEVGIAPTSVLSGAGGAATSWNGAATERARSNARHVREVGERDGASFACPRAGRPGGNRPRGRGAGAGPPRPGSRAGAQRGPGRRGAGRGCGGGRRRRGGPAGGRGEPGPGAAVRGGSREGGVAVVTRNRTRPRSTSNERTAT